MAASERYRKLSGEIDQLEPLEKGIILLLYAPGALGKYGEPVTGKTRLVKMLFLMGKEVDVNNLVDSKMFLPYKYGPYNEQIDGAIEELEGNELVSRTGSPQRFELTLEGAKLAKQVWASLSEAQKQRLFLLKKQYSRMPLSQVLSYVYNKYPEYTVASEIRDEIFDA